MHNADAAQDVHAILLNLVKEERISEERIKGFMASYYAFETPVALK